MNVKMRMVCRCTSVLVVQMSNKEYNAVSSVRLYHLNERS